MTERSIVLADHEVRATLGGTKTQLRRPLRWKLREPGLNLGFSGLEVGFYCSNNPASGYVLRSRGYGDCWNDRTWPAHCPFGKVGDRLRVREVWAPVARDGFAWVVTREGTNAIYRADGVELPDPYESDPRWRGARCMPRSVSRLFLEIIEVRVQRVQSVSESDILAEGIADAVAAGLVVEKWNDIPDIRTAWRLLWTRRYGAESWERNDWVWALTTKRVDRYPADI